MRAIEVEYLVREFKKGPRAVDGINLHVDAGEIYGFLGPNGAGKTTTVSMLTTLLAPSSGRATVAGFDVVTEGSQVRRSIGAALQEAALDPLLSAREHLILQAGLHGFSNNDAMARTEELLHRVGLTAAAERKIRTYSGGMKRRLDLALALVHHPRIIFLDEPTTGLDIQSRTALWEEVASLAKDEGVTVFLTTQYLEEADVLADRVGIIDRGRIVAEGSPADLKAEIGRATVEVVPLQGEDHARVEAILTRFGEPALGAPDAATVRLYGDAAALADIVRAMDAEGVRISDLQLHAPTLDDVFLAKTGRSLEGAGQGADQEPPPVEQQVPAYQAQYWPYPAPQPAWQQPQQAWQPGQPWPAEPQPAWQPYQPAYQGAPDPQQAWQQQSQPGYQQPGYQQSQTGYTAPGAYPYAPVPAAKQGNQGMLIAGAVGIAVFLLGIVLIIALAV